METLLEDKKLSYGQANELVHHFLEGKIEHFSESQLDLLQKSKSEILPNLEILLSNEINLLQKHHECLENDDLYLGLHLAKIIKATELFKWIIELCYLPIEILEDHLYDDYVTEELPFLIADTLSEWDLLKPIIENTSIDIFIRSACLEALVFKVASNQVDRSKLIEYFKSLLNLILEGELDDDELCTHLVNSCADLWPEECLEEIRECFGYTLVDQTFLQLDDVLTQYSKGKDYCIEEIKKRMKQDPFLIVKPLEKTEAERKRLDQELFQKVKKFLKESAENLALTPLNPKKLERNALCPCGSQKKYKKCCINKSDLLYEELGIKIDESNLTFDPIEESEHFKLIPRSDLNSIRELYYLIESNPEKVISQAPMYIEKYPNIPFLYNYLYSAYRSLDRPCEAFKFLKKMHELLPDYLFSRTEYALYRLRRKEPEKAYEALGKARSLLDLYPKRKIFHFTEWQAFAYTMSLYWIELNDFDLANAYCKTLQKITPNSKEAKAVQQKIKAKFQLNFINKRFD